MHKLLAPLLAFFVFFSPKPTTRSSVEALQMDGRTFCTAFSINQSEGLWATAAHCAQYSLEHTDHYTTIMGAPATVIYVGFPATDIAVFQADAHSPAVHLSKQAPSVGDSLYVVGYPLGITKTNTYGHMGARLIALAHPSTGYFIISDLLDVTVAPGNSGSPVFNAAGELIGVLWGDVDGAPVGLSTSYEGTMRVLAPYLAH